MFKKKIPVFSLVLLIVAALDSIRNYPATALFGSSLIFFFLLSALLFLFPISLISAELSSRFPVQGGVFHWVRQGLGEKTAVLAIWLQWINTMVWYPTILSFLAGTTAYLFNPELAQNKGFVIGVSLTFFWALTLFNMLGIRASVRFNSICNLLGTLFPTALLFFLGLVWVLRGDPLAISFAPSHLIPSLQDSQNWVALIAIMASFLGMELSGVHVSDAENPQRNFPRAIGWSVAVLLALMIFGSLSIAVVIPQQQIHLVDGVMQTFTIFFDAFKLPFFIPVLTLLIIVGSVGQMINWLIAPARGLLQVAEYGFLPSSFFTVRNRHGVAVRVLVAQGIAVTLFSLSFMLMPSINGFYWFLTDLSTGLYMMMYLLIFWTALRLGRPAPEEESVFRIPRGSRTLACSLGLLGCLLTIVVGYLPPDGLNVGTGARYGTLVAIGNGLSLAPVLLFFWWKKRQHSQH